MDKMYDLSTPETKINLNEMGDDTPEMKQLFIRSFFDKISRKGFLVSKNL